MKRTDFHEKSRSRAEKSLGRSFERRVRLSWFALLAERLWEALLWPFLVIASFLILTLFDVWGYLPPLLHRGLLFAFGIAFLISLFPLVRLPIPGREKALRRLEQNSGIKHRPATSYEDNLTVTAKAGDTAQIWALHRQRLAKLLARLKPSWPAPRTDRKDPYAIRAALFLVLIVAALAAGPNVWNRLTTALAPAPSGQPTLLRLDAWVTPPVYTGLAPIVLADGREQVGTGAESFRALTVPEGSQLIVRAYAPQGESVMVLTDTGKKRTETTAATPKTSVKQGLSEFNLTLGAPGSAEVQVGGEMVAKWRFELIEDEPPSIVLVGQPTTTPRAALRLNFRAADDHGVASAEARFALAEALTEDKAPIAPKQAAKADPLREPPKMPIQLPRMNAKELEGHATQDLTGHPWAGLKVKMTLFARDQAEQTGASEVYQFVLPERKFTKPLAKAIVEQRKMLVRKPHRADLVARALDALTIGAEHTFDKPSIYLSIRNAYWRLKTDLTPEGHASVADQLWTIALRIEDGDLPRAERDLRSAQEELMKALQANASQEEIQKLVEELRNALGQYLQELAQQQQQKGNMPPQESKDGDQLVSQQDFDKMLKNIEELAKSGSKDLAQQMLSELKDILDRLQTGNFPDNAQQQRDAKMMEDLNDLVSKQQKLMEETFNARRREQGNDNQAFEVSPPGQPMDFGPGMFMDQEFPPQQGQDDKGAQQGPDQPGESAQGRSGGQGKMGQSGARPKGQGRFDDLGKRQSELRDTLQGLIDRFRGEGANAPDQFNDAGDAMGEAKDALEDENLGRAAEEQGRALEQLREGAQSLAEQMQANDNQEGQAQGESGRDPLGRPDRSNRPDLGLSVKVPDQIDIQRAREVLDELRRRLGDPSRPAIELDYLERLIRSY
jgi:uncharacterized protein (TIGR02302 family)